MGHEPPAKDHEPRVPDPSEVYTWRLARASADSTKLAAWLDPTTEAYGEAQLCVLGRLANIHALHQSDQFRAAMTRERDMRGDDEVVGGTWTRARSDPSADSDEDMDDFDMSEHMYAPVELDEGAAAMVSVLEATGIVGRGPGDTASMSPRGADICSDNAAARTRVEELDAAQKKAKAEALKTMMGGDAASKPSVTVDGHEDSVETRGTLDASQDDVLHAGADPEPLPVGALSRLDVGRPLTIEETIRTGAEDYDAKTPYGKPLNTKQARLRRELPRRASEGNASSP